MNQNDCTHTTPAEDVWVPNKDHDPVEWGMDGFDAGPGEWESGRRESTTVDIDLHRYECTQCGKVMYYSSTAREHFENGKSFNIKGLE